MFPLSAPKSKVQLSEHTSFSPEEQRCHEGEDFVTLACSSAWHGGGTLSEWWVCKGMNTNEWVNQRTEMIWKTVNYGEVSSPCSAQGGVEPHTNVRQTRSRQHSSVSEPTQLRRPRSKRQSSEWKLEAGTVSTEQMG